ncbi:AAA family ATPase [Collinsella tanakaei]|nr:AAA family ATPase [Collinsella tanakaei]
MSGSQRPEAVPYPGQWRLARIDLANWGTFGGFHTLPIDRRGTLITGASGSGKSTLLDAVAAVLTPPSNLNLNAAANNGSTRDRGRSISNYVRGAYSNVTDATGEIVHAYLRPRAATWSGVLLRYEDGVSSTDASGEAARGAVNLLAIFFQKANSTSPDGLSRFYAVLRGDFALRDFERYGRAGADLTAFNKDFRSIGRGYRRHSDFEARLCRMLHIESPKTLVLLHKTQAAKNIGSLDDLFRTYMLETPRTFDLARDAVEQFDELQQAYRGVVDQREQMDCLQPLVTCSEQYRLASDEIEHLEALQAQLPLFVEQTVVACLKHGIEQAKRRADDLTERVREAQAEQTSAQQRLEALIAQMSESGGIALDTAKLHIEEERKHLALVEQNRASLALDLASIGEQSLPDTHTQFEALKRLLSERTDEANAWLQGNERAKVEAYGTVNELQHQRSEIDRELRYLRGHPSNVPHKLHAIRAGIAEHLGISIEEVPFMAELIDIRPESSAWQGAIERVLGGRAKTMLVSRRYAPAITRYLESRHLGTRFDFDAVPDQVEVPPLPVGTTSLVRKVSVAPTPRNETLARWTHKTLRERFDYACVDDPADMQRHKRALTMGGQVKNGPHHVKDDRFAVNDSSRWVLGSSNDRKIEQLEQRVRDLDERLAAAQKTTEELTRRERESMAVCRIFEMLDSKSWSDYDLEQAQEDFDAAVRFYRQIANSDALRSVAQQREEADARCKAANAAVEQAKVEQQLAERTVAREEAKLAESEARLASLARRAQERTTSAPVDPDAIERELHDLLAKIDSDFPRSVDAARLASQEATERLADRERRQQRIAQTAVRDAEKVMTSYRERWRAQAADLSVTFEDCEVYLARYRQIKVGGLPEHEQKFLDVLTDFSRDQITVIASEIRGAFREVRDRLEPVNRSLLLSEYSPGIHLQIEVLENRGARVKEFLASLTDITSGSWENGDLDAAEQRYKRTAAVMERLGSGEPADVQWRRAVLDTTRHMRFVANEVSSEGCVVNVHSNDGGLSGGQKQKLVFFCLAAALRYQLADEDQPVPTYGTVVFDEAFDKSDRRFAEEALSIFERFGFHLVLATPEKLLQVAEDHIGSVVVVSCEDQQRSHLCPIVFEDRVPGDAAREPEARQ